MNDYNLFYKKGLCGLTNLGNTCFMNSIIQCLSSNTEFIKLFLTNNYKEDLNTRIPDYKLLEQWILLVRGLYNKNAIVTPTSFHRCIQHLSIEKGNHTFSGFMQNDSQEFLQFLIEALHNSMSKKVIMNITGTPTSEIDKMAVDAYTSWKLYFKNDYSKIIEMFYGQFISNIETLEDISFHSKTYDPFSNISLEIPILNKKINIYDCLDLFTTKEPLDEFKQHKEDMRKYTKNIRLWSTPTYLIIFFKRFNKKGLKKIDLIDFPITGLNLNKYVAGYDQDNNIFDLYAISNHSGDLHGGHYWAYTKNYDNQWYKFNDSHVTLKDPNELITDSAYCLFYKKIN